VRSRRLALLLLMTLPGFVIGAAYSSEVFRVIVLVAAVGVGTWVLRGIVGEMREPAPTGRTRRRVFDTYWPARCSHCGARGGPRLRMVAGRDAYICELCLRRGVELLDSPDDITRFI
jgi:ClpX C4-type zinc finger